MTLTEPASDQSGDARRRKVTRAQRHELVQVYLNLGWDAAAELCREYGVSDEYARREANALYGCPGAHRRQWRKAR